MLHAHLDVRQLDDRLGLVGARLGKPRRPAATGWGLDLEDLRWLQQDRAMPGGPSPGSWSTLRRSGVRRFHPWGIRGGRPVGRAGVPLPLGLKACDPCREPAHPFGLVPTHGQPVDDQCLHDMRCLCPTGSIQP